MSFRKFVLQKVCKYIPDKPWLEFKYYSHFRKPLDLKDPKTFNEKLQWLKLYYQKESHTRMVDKCEMKAYVTEKVGPGYVVPLLGVWDSVDAIDFDALPDKFVLKTTHDCAGLVICTDKAQLDVEQAKQKLRAAMKNSYYLYYREWPYKNVVPRVIAEEYMVDESGTQLKDYKIFCFDGEPYCVAVDYDRFAGHKQRLYSLDWERMQVSRGYRDDPDVVIERPDTLEAMIGIARELSKGEPFVRIDFYSINHRPYVGEITFFPASGYVGFIPEQYDRIFGDMIVLPEKIMEKDCVIR